MGKWAQHSPGFLHRPVLSVDRVFFVCFLFFWGGGSKRKRSMLIHCKRNDLLNVHRDATSWCCWDPGLVIQIILPLGETVSKVPVKSGRGFQQGYLNYMKHHSVHHLFDCDLPWFPDLIQSCYWSILKASESLVFNLVFRNSTVCPTPFYCKDCRAKLE